MMYKVINFDSWFLDSDCGSNGSGAIEKIWLVNPQDGKRGLFKFPKIKSDGSVTGEYYAEKIASELGRLIKMPCADVDIGTYKGRVGSISYNFLKNNEFLNEGINFIQERYPSYNKNKFEEALEGLKYNVQMLKNLNINFEDILKMIIFDALIGNSDRHHSNWGYIVEENNNTCSNIRFCPLYDNGSSLCSYVNDYDIKDILRDKNRYNALIDTKSKSCIGWEDERPIRHFELIKKIKANYYNETIDFVKEIKQKLTNSSIKNILDSFENNVIVAEKKKLLFKVINDRKLKILEIYGIDGEKNDNE